MDDFVTVPNLGPQFDVGVTVPNLITIQGTPVLVDTSFSASSTVSGNGNGNGTILALTGTRSDPGWIINANTMSFTGSPDRVHITAMCEYNQGVNTPAMQRIAPVLKLYKNGNIIRSSASAYQRHTANHFQSSNTIALVDTNPGVNPVYQLRAFRGSNQTDVLNIDLGNFEAIAINKVSITGV